jgi:DNA-binding transcriptional ArsR family regulator
MSKEQLTEFLLDPQAVKTSARIVQALNHCLRQSILDSLNQAARLSVSELCHVLRQRQSAISQHLGVLRKAGLVHTTREGAFSYYSANHTRLNEVGRQVSTLLAARQEPV